MKHQLKSILRPAFTLAISLGLLSFSPDAVMAQTTATISPSQPGYYRIQVGDFEVIALSDGTIPQELPKLLTNIQPGEDLLRAIKAMRASSAVTKSPMAAG